MRAHLRGLPLANEFFFSSLPSPPFANNMHPRACKSCLLISHSGGHLINKLRLIKKRLAETRPHRPHVSHSSITPSRPKQLLMRPATFFQTGLPKMIKMQTFPTEKKANFLNHQKIQKEETFPAGSSLAEKTGQVANKY